MTGAEHYREAERLIANLDKGEHGDGTAIVRDDDRPVIALAQVHATLAAADFIATVADRMPGGA